MFLSDSGNVSSSLKIDYLKWLIQNLVSIFTTEVWIRECLWSNSVELSGGKCEYAKAR